MSATAKTLPKTNRRVAEERAPTVESLLRRAIKKARKRSPGPDLPAMAKQIVASAAFRELDDVERTRLLEEAVRQRLGAHYAAVRSAISNGGQNGTAPAGALPAAATGPATSKLERAAQAKRDELYDFEEWQVFTGAGGTMKWAFDCTPEDFVAAAEYNEAQAAPFLKNVGKYRKAAALIEETPGAKTGADVREGLEEILSA